MSAQMKPSGGGEMQDLEHQLIELANRQYESAEYQRLFSAPLTHKNIATYYVQHSHFVLNRRDCWGYVQGAAPMEIKKLIWAHEEDELQGNRERGTADHYTLAINQGASVGLTPDDFRNSVQMDGTFVSMQAWLNVAQKSHWLEGFAASSILEVANSDELIRGGCYSRRMGEKLNKELGIPLRKQYSTAEHVVADVAHGLMMFEVAREYCHDEATRQLVLSGAKKSLAIARIWYGYLGHVLATSA